MEGSGLAHGSSIPASCERAGSRGAGGAGGALWSFGSSRERLCFSPVLWSLVDFAQFRLLVQYAAARQLPAVSYRNPFTAVRLATGRQLVVERERVGRDFELEGEEVGRFAGRFFGDAASDDDLLAEMIPFERLAEGLQDYF